MANNAVDVINLVSSDDEEQPNISTAAVSVIPTIAQPPVPKRPRVSGPAPVIGSSSIAPNDDDEIEFVSHMTRKSRDTPATNSGNEKKQEPMIAEKTAPPISNDEDEELIVVSKKTGVQANIDYPHNRFSCGVHPFGRSEIGNRAYCDKCFCYVCDDSASKCTEWYSHSSATDKIHRWRGERTKAARARSGLTKRTTPIKKRAPIDFFTPRSRNRNRCYNMPSLRPLGQRSTPNGQTLPINTRDIIPPSSFGTSLPSFTDNVMAILGNQQSQSRVQQTVLTETRSHNLLAPVSSSTANALDALDNALSLRWPRPQPPRMGSTALLHSTPVPRSTPIGAPVLSTPTTSIVMPPPLPTRFSQFPLDLDGNQSDCPSFETVRRALSTPSTSTADNSLVPPRMASGSRNTRSWTIPSDMDNSPPKLPPLVSPNELSEVPPSQVVPPAPSEPLPSVATAVNPAPQLNMGQTNNGANVTTPFAVDDSNAQQIVETTQDGQNTGVARNNFSISSIVQPRNSNDYSRSPRPFSPQGQVANTDIIDSGEELKGYVNTYSPSPSASQARTENNQEGPRLAPIMFDEAENEMGVNNDTSQPMQGVSRPEPVSPGEQATNMQRRDPASPGSSSQSRDSTPATERIRMRTEQAVLDPLKGLVNMGLDGNAITMGDLASVLNNSGEQ